MAAVLPARAGVVSHSATFASSGWSDSTVVVDNTNYSLHTFAGLDDDGNSGAPMLPCKAVTFSVPYNATNFTVTLSKSSISTGSDSYVCYPIPQPIPTDGSGTGGEVICDSTIYHTNAFYPASPVSVVADGFFMGENHLVTVAIYPMQVNPVTRAWRKFTAMDVTLSYDIDTIFGPGILMSQSNRWRTQDQQTAQQMVANPTAVAQNAPPATAGTHYHAPASGTNPIDELGGYEYTIITTRAQEPAYKRLVAWKRMKGYTAGTVCVEDINNYATQLHNMYGSNIEFPIGEFYDEIQDSVGVIRNYLRGAKAQKGTRYVLMGGEGVPYRTAYFNSERQPETDYYLIDLHSNWNTYALYHHIGAFHDYYFDSYFDNMPDLFVGRLVSLNKAEVDNYINKLLRYEVNPGNGDRSYLRNSFYYQHFYTPAGEENKYYDYTKGIVDGFDIIHTNARQINSALGVSGTTIVDELNETLASFVSFQMHGCGWAFTTHDIKDPKKKCFKALSTQFVDSGETFDNELKSSFDSINNRYSPFLLYTISCDVMPFSYYKNYGRISNGHSFTCGNYYGGPAFMGNTAVGLHNDANNAEIRFAEEIHSGRFKVGEADVFSKIDINAKYTTMVHNLMGEPEFEMWTYTPQQVYPIIARSNGGITVGGLPYNQTFLISYYDNDGTVGMDSITNGNIILTNVSPHAGVMVYRHNYLPWIAPLTLQNVNNLSSQYVFASSFYAGSQVDLNRTNGDVVIPAGTDYEVEFFGEARLMPGFQVEKGAEFKLLPSNY